MSSPARKHDRAPELGRARGAPAPLRECVREALDAYLEALDGVEPNELFRLVMEQVEPPMIEAVLARTRGNQSRAAQMLGINRGTLRKKLKLYGLE